MTKENSKKLYDHYINIGYEEAAKNLEAKYPDFEGTAEVKEEEPKTKKKKGKE